MNIFAKYIFMYEPTEQKRSFLCEPFNRSKKKYFSRHNDHSNRLWRYGCSINSYVYNSERIDFLKRKYNEQAF